MLCFDEAAESDDCEHSVQQESLVRELIAGEPCLRVEVKNECENGRYYAYDRYPLITHLLLGEDAKEEETEQWPVGVRGYFIDGLDNRIVVEQIYDIDECCH